jgi:hypothetical protein
MAYKPGSLSVLAYANDFTLWHYGTEDSTDEVLFAPGYFNPVVDMLRAGDMIIMNAGPLRRVVTIWVESTADTTVKVSITRSN